MLTTEFKGFVQFIFAVSVMCLFSCPVWADAWIASVDQRNGLPIISIGGVKALSSQFVFWGKNWAWAGMSSEFKVVAPFEYSIVGNDHALNFELKGNVRKPSNQQLVWEFDLEAPSATSDVIGGGIAFRLDQANFTSELGEPELLPDNRGWSWGHTGGSRLEMRFDPPLSSVYFEPGQKSEIRAFFYKGEVPGGRRHYVATLSISGDMTVGPTDAERFGLDDVTKWPTGLLDWETAPVDLSFLNAPEKPAGKHGFLTAIKDKLLFQDGTTGRFWGTNLAAYALFGTDRESVRRAARRLSELGFNLVRFHHQDSPWVNPNIFGDAASLDTKNLSPPMLEKLDWWIKCLKDEGIYVWLDLDTQRNLKAGDDIDHFAEISKGKPTADLKGYNYVNTSIQEIMQRFNQAYVNHVNFYTGLAYKDDPAIVTMLLTNENDVTFHFGNALLPDKNVPWHNAIYMAQAEAFAARNELPKGDVWKSWLPGPSKLFLNDLEHQFDDKIIRQLRTLGVKSTIVTTSKFGGTPLSVLPALTTGNLVDVHSYGGADELKKNPMYGPNLMDWIAAAQIVGRPLSVSEWNVESFPIPDRGIIPLYIASSASLQGWDALMQFAYSQQPLNNPGRPSNWDSFNDPAMIATLPAAALLFRRHHVREANTTYVFAPTPDELFNQQISPMNSVALRTAAEKGRLMIALPQTRELPWLEESQIPSGAHVINDLELPVIGKNDKTAVSDTGELQRNWDQGTYTINTAQTQAAMGWIGGKKISLDEVEIAVTTRNATVAVQSLDEKAISDSRAILISLGARSTPTSPNQMPFHSEPVTGWLSIRAIKGLRLYKRQAHVESEIPIEYKDGRYKINLDQTLHTYWLQLK
jgi:hypothetical protein